MAAKEKWYLIVGVDRDWSTETVKASDPVDAVLNAELDALETSAVGPYAGYDVYELASPKPVKLKSAVRVVPRD